MNTVFFSEERKRQLFAPCSIALLIFLVWGQTLTFDFVWDDGPFILENKAIQSLDTLPGIFWRLDAQSSMPEGFVLFRPLRTIHYAALYFIGGAQFHPWLYHLANLVWHAAASLLLFALLQRLLKWAAADAGHELESDALNVRQIAWLGAAAFAIHPVTSEVVCWVKSLDDIMATTFALAASLALIRMKVALALLWFVLALYSKESAAPFVAIAFLIFKSWHNLSWRAAIVKTSGFAIAAFVYVVHRHFVIGRTSQSAPISGSYGQTLFDTLQVVPEYFRLLFGIPPFIADYTFQQAGLSLASGTILLSIGILAALVVFGIWLAQRNQKLAAFGLAWVGLFLLPVSNLLPMMQYMAERFFLYLPLIGWIAFLLALWFRAPQSSTLAARTLVWAAVLAAWSGLASNRAGVWRDELTLFATTYAQGHASPRVEQNAISGAFDQPEVRAVFEFNETSKRARLLRKPSREEAALAVQSLTRASELLPRSADISAALGILHASAGNTKAAIHYFEFATRQKPKDPAFRANLGQAFIEDKQLAAAHGPLDRALVLDANYTEAWRSKSQVHWLQENYRDAVLALKKLQQLEPANRVHAEWIQRGEELLAKP